MSIIIQTKALPMAFCNQVYSFSMEAETHPYRPVAWWIDDETPLPWGLTMNDKGKISGIPQRTQRISMQFYAMANNPDEICSSILNMNVYEQLEILNETLWETSISSFDDIKMSAKGGVPPYQWKCDSLPIGLRMIDDVITGRPQVSGGITPVRVCVKDSAGNTAVGDFKLKIHQ